MNITQVCIDCYNQTVYVRLDDLSHVFSTYDRFVELTGFVRGTTLNVTYEFERSMFAVEYEGGLVLAGRGTPEVEWIHNNISAIQQAALSDQSAMREFEPTMRHRRDGLLVETDWVFSRHTEQVLVGATPTLTQQQLQQVSDYRQQLRDLPDVILSSRTYNAEDWPTLPSFLS